VTGSAGGSPREPQWFRNLRTVDRAVVEVGDRRLDVDVKVADPAERAALWARLVERSPFFAKYQAKVEREIPMAVLTPRR
jgi:deazaflavin-dependent oxidoreductase (nitroreductase family)